MCVDLMPSAEIDRLPELRYEIVLGLAFPAIAVAPFEASAAAKLRFALRAAYFGLLAGLSQREWLTIRRDRTNREYLIEFTRRWRRRPQATLEARTEIPEKLRGSLRLFDRVWYGLHAVTPEAVTTYRQDQREFLNHV